MGLAHIVSGLVIWARAGGAKSAAEEENPSISTQVGLVTAIFNQLQPWFRREGKEAGLQDNEG